MVSDGIKEQGVFFSRSFWDQLLPVMLSVYVFCVFIPRGVTALERIGLVVALLVSLCNGRWRQALPYLRHGVIGALVLFVIWLGVTTLWSLNPLETFSSVTGVFKDYFLLLIPILYVMTQPALRVAMFRYFAYALVIIILINGWQYLHEWWVTPEVLSDFKLHRGWSHPLLFFFPFVLLQYSLTREKGSRQQWLWLSILVVAVLMLVGTGARAAWLATAAMVAIWLSFEFNWRRLMLLASACLVLGFGAYLTVPFVHMKFAQGLDTSGRVGGVWTAAVDMIKDRPLLGYGFSKDVYNQEFLRRLDSQPNWSIRRAIGPHSNYLEIAYAGGLVGLGFLLTLYLTVIGSYLVAIRRISGMERYLLTAPLASFVGFYVVRGGFESVRWAPMIFPLACLGYFFLESRRQRNVETFKAG